jgi:hypothetical protein
VKDAVGSSRVFSPIALLGLTVCLAGAALFASAVASGSAGSATGKILVYAVPTRAQFLNNADDRQRAIINNPFTANTAKLMTVMKGHEKTTGPLPGDTALYSFNLYTSASMKKKAGTAVYTCDYNFNSKALCQAYYELSGGTLLASGPVDFSTFNSTKFELSVRGGTDTYLGARGELEVSPPPKTTDTRRLDFTLVGG